MCTLDTSINPKAVPCHNASARVHHDVGMSTDRTIAGLDQRLFDVNIVNDTAEVIRPIPYPKQPKRRALPLPLDLSMQEQLLLRPSFFEHFDTVVVDYRYIEQHTAESLAKEGRYTCTHKHPPNHNLITTVISLQLLRGCVRL